MIRDQQRACDTALLLRLDYCRDLNDPGFFFRLGVGVRKV
jgi:hypothetical protein